MRVSLSLVNRCWAALAIAALVSLGAAPAGAQDARPEPLVRAVRSAITAGQFERAISLVDQRRAAAGATPEVIAAISWLGRGAYAAGRLDEAAQFAAEAHDLALEALKTTRLEDSADLEIGLGAAIETEGLVRAARGARAEAVYFLSRELETYAGSPIHKRLQKNINLLSLEGAKAPALQTAELIGSVRSLDAMNGNVVLLFFWAHWCGDCKAQAPIVASVLEKYRAQGLRLVAPTQRFGYIVAGTAAPPQAERRHIEAVRDQYYPFLKTAPVPLDVANHQRYGVSTTPTLVVVDR
ncbi:MAG: TlpA family protein disulfide reductase, partial [Vicinamibacterales bacterium]